MKWPEAGEAPARLANRMLGEQAWAREKLAPFAGRAFSLAVGPAVAAWSIRADGTLEAVPTGVDADLKLSLSPLSIPTFLADPARWNEFVTEDGDAELGGFRRATDREYDVMRVRSGAKPKAARGGSAPR